jgi:hypothetical protein
LVAERRASVIIETLATNPILMAHVCRSALRARTIVESAVGYKILPCLHELHSKKLNGVILKLDFEKNYNKVKWSFVHQTLRMKGFQLSDVL